MTSLPDELWTDILDYLDPSDLVSSQRVSHRLLKSARDPALWRNKVFEKAPSAVHSRYSNPNALSALTGALGGLSLGDSTSAHPTERSDTFNKSRLSQRAKAILEWDNSDRSEAIDWYSEYIARHAPLSTIWAENGAQHHEIRGMALFNSADKVLGTLEDGSLAVWNIQRTEQGQRRLSSLGKSRSGLIFEDMFSLGESSLAKRVKSFGSAVDNISIDSKRMRAFVAMQNVLNEVDLEKMEVISQNKFAWPITALSQESDTDCELTIGTSFSLHIHDPRLPLSEPVDDISRVDSNDDSKIAFLENYTKACDLRVTSAMESSHDNFRDYSVSSNRLEAYARIEPGPQSILHRGDNEIIIAGRMPSILFYDRRNFPIPRTAIHSGARLSAMTTLPVQPARAGSETKADSTLITCGEYGGRGSLELYELPWNKKMSTRDLNSSPDAGNVSPELSEPFSFRNRQEASSSKLLSVATQGTRIVFSDAEGVLKWVERDGRGLARRWNINEFRINDRGASVSGDKVVRKMIALPEEENGRGTRGDGDLLVWTGENIGIVTSKPKPWSDHDELVQAFERGMNLNDGERHDQDKEAEYSNIMRQALERQADERRWMSRFGVRRW